MAERHVPVRTCIGCRQAVPAGELVRYVFAGGDGGDGRVQRDATGHAPGRGAWLHDRDECHTKAERKRAFRRALRIPTGASAQLPRHAGSDDGDGHVTSPNGQGRDGSDR